MFIVPISSTIQPVESKFNDGTAAAAADSIDTPQFSHNGRNRRPSHHLQQYDKGFGCG